MEKIASFTIDHLKLVPGLYVSRRDEVNGNPITTFDIRMTSPNDEPVMNTAEVHTLEHIGATFLRNHPDFKDKVLYFRWDAGPDFICFWQDNISRKISLGLSGICSVIYLDLKEKCQAQQPGTAAIIWT